MCPWGQQRRYRWSNCEVSTTYLFAKQRSDEHVYCNSHPQNQPTGSLPDNWLMCTIVPEQERFWHQNLAKSVLKLPSAVAFLPKHSILAIADKSSSTVFLANLHNPVCLIQIAGPKDSISSPVGIVFKDCQIIVFNSGTSSSIKIIDISYVLKKSRALL